jgi:hypothetical protein
MDKLFKMADCSKHGTTKFILTDTYKLYVCLRCAKMKLYHPVIQRDVKKTLEKKPLDVPYSLEDV